MTSQEEQLLKGLSERVNRTQVQDKDDEADKLTAALSKADEALGMKTPFDSSFCNPTLTTAGIR